MSTLIIKSWVSEKHNWKDIAFKLDPFYSSFLFPSLLSFNLPCRSLLSVNTSDYEAI